MGWYEVGRGEIGWGGVGWVGMSWGAVRWGGLGWDGLGRGGVGCVGCQGVGWCVVGWCGWCDVVWCDVVWCGVVWNMMWLVRCGRSWWERDGLGQRNALRRITSAQSTPRIFPGRSPRFESQQGLHAGSSADGCLKISHSSSESSSSLPPAPCTRSSKSSAQCRPGRRQAVATGRLTANAASHSTRGKTSPARDSRRIAERSTRRSARNLLATQTSFACRHLTIDNSNSSRIVLPGASHCLSAALRGATGVCASARKARRNAFTVGCRASTSSQPTVAEKRRCGPTIGASDSSAFSCTRISATLWDRGEAAR